MACRVAGAFLSLSLSPFSIPFVPSYSRIYSLFLYSSSLDRDVSFHRSFPQSPLYSFSFSDVRNTRADFRNAPNAPLSRAALTDQPTDVLLPEIKRKRRSRRVLSPFLPHIHLFTSLQASPTHPARPAASSSSRLLLRLFFFSQPRGKVASFFFSNFFW